MTKQWHDIIRERMQHYEEQPPQDLLRDIKAEMARRGLMDAPPTTPAHAPVVRLWVRRVASAAAVVALAFGAWMWYRNALPNAEQLAQGNNHPHTTTTSSSTTTASDASQESLLAAQGDIMSDVKAHLRSAAALLGIVDASEDKPSMLATSSAENSESLLAMGTPSPESSSTTEPSTPTTPQKETSTLPSQPSTERPSTHSGQSYPSTEPSWRSHTSTSSAWSVGTYYGGATGSNQQTQGVMLAAATPLGATSNEAESKEASNVLLGTEDIRTATKHHQPIRMGVSVRYRINERWSAQSGVTYTYLSSDFTQQHNQQTHQQTQRLHYVGVPVSVSYNFKQGRHYTLYATAGGEASKLVHGSMTTTQTNSRTESSETVKETRPQFSVNAALGAEYRFSEGTSLYVEPGVTRYINNGSQVENVFKKKPTNFSLNVGFRININK